jgi:hypothetical protein
VTEISLNEHRIETRRVYLVPTIHYRTRVPATVLNTMVLTALEASLTNVLQIELLQRSLFVREYVTITYDR